MTDSIQRIRIFVASANDLAAEREEVRSAVDRINRSLGRQWGLHLDLWLWERDLSTGLGRPQDRIDPELAEADIVIFLLWRRIGSPTGKSRAATEEEWTNTLDRAKQVGRPKVMIYASQKPVDPATLLNGDGLEQLKALREFMNAISREATITKYTTLEEFSDRVHDDLVAAARAWTSLRPAPTTKREERRPTTAPPQPEVRTIDLHYGDRPEAHQFAAAVNQDLLKQEFAPEVIAGMEQVILELYTNSNQHQTKQHEGESACRMEHHVNSVYSRLRVTAPKGHVYQLSPWTQEARTRIREDPYSPSGRGLLLISELADEFHQLDEQTLAVTMYRERVVLESRQLGTVQVIDILAGQRNPSLPRRVADLIQELAPDRLILNVEGRQDEEVRPQAEYPVVELADNTYEATRSHSGTTTVFAMVMPMFSRRPMTWRVVCRNRPLRKLLPKDITHPTIASALKALEELGGGVNDASET